MDSDKERKKRKKIHFSCTDHFKTAVTPAPLPQSFLMRLTTLVLQSQKDLESQDWVLKDLQSKMSNEKL